MRIRRLIATSATVLGVVGGGLAWQCGQAGAQVTHVGGSSFGSFNSIQGIAVDEASGDVYVYDVGAGSLEKFSAEGQPAEFSALKEDAITGLGGSPLEVEVAVDNSGGATQGDIYVANGSSVLIFGPDGKALGELNAEVEKAGGPWGEPCGVAVDGSGRVYVGLLDGHVNRYTPSSGTVTNADYGASLSGLPGICDIAADAQGDVYATVLSGGPVMKYEASQFGLPTASGTQVEGGRFVLALDPVDQSLYLGSGEFVIQQTPDGKFADIFAGEGAEAIFGSDGLAVNGASDRVYAANGNAVEIFDPLTISDITPLEASNVTATSATVSGTVDPEGLTVTVCEFIYIGTANGVGQASAPCSPMPGASSTPVAVSLQLTGLIPNSEYIVRPYLVDSHRAMRAATSTNRTVRFHTLAPPPTLSDETATSISATGATLGATLNAENSETSFSYVYGTTAAYGRESAPLTAGSAFANRSVAARLEGLQPGTTYHYALIAHNQAGTVKGPDSTFTTAAATPPTLSGVSVQGVGPGAATIIGTVSSNGLPTQYEIQFGADTSYQTRQAGEVTASSQGLSMALIFLQPGTTYHYRVVASNEDGSVVTADQTFTTPLYQLQIPPVLPPLTTPTIAFPTGSQANTAKPRASGRRKAKTRRRAKHVRRPKTKHRRR